MKEDSTPDVTEDEAIANGYGTVEGTVEYVGPDEAMVEAQKPLQQRRLWAAQQASSLLRKAPGFMQGQPGSVDDIIELSEYLLYGVEYEDEEKSQDVAGLPWGTKDEFDWAVAQHQDRLQTNDTEGRC